MLDRRRFLTACVAGAVLALGGAWAFAGSPREGFAPDPPEHPSTKQWTFEISHQNGTTKIEKVTSKTLSAAASTPRLIGRFALELYVGHELLDRVRFNVPLIGDDEMERSPKKPIKPPIWAKVTTKLTAKMADHPRAAALHFVDRSNGNRQIFFWPPGEDGKLTPLNAKSATTSDGGVSGDGGQSDGGLSDGGLSDGGLSDGGQSDGGSQSAEAGVSADGGQSDGGLSADGGVSADAARDQ